MLLKKATFTGNNELYIIATMGSNFGSAEKYIRKIAKRQKMDFMGFKGVCMPDNYLISNSMISNSEAITKIQKTIPTIYEISKSIANHSRLTRNKIKIKDRFLSSVVNWGFNKFAKNSKSFNVLDSCIKCKKCIQDCPVNNITLDKGIIKFGNDCMLCLSCIHHCPVHAIDYNGQGTKNGYYTCPSDLEILNK